MKLCLATAAVLAVALAHPVSAQDTGAAEFAATTLSLSADAQVQAVPDLANVQVGVRAQAPTASSAMSEQRRRMAAVFDALKAQGVADRDIQTSELSLEAQYADDGRAPRRLTGYQASNTVIVRLHDSSARVGLVVDALVASGANEIDGVGFELADPTAAQDDARRLALRALQAKADLYAQATGYHIRRLVRLSEGGGVQPRPMAMPMMALRRVSSPVAAGELTVEVSVSGVYELSR